MAWLLQPLEIQLYHIKQYHTHLQSVCSDNHLSLRLVVKTSENDESLFDEVPSLSR